MVQVISLPYDRTDVNVSLLHDEIMAVVDLPFVGISGGPKGTRVHVASGATDEQKVVISDLVAAHNPLLLSSDQQNELDRAAAIDALRKPWVEWTFEDKDVFIRLMAKKMGLF